MSSIVDRVTAVAVTLCAVVVSGTLLYRTLGPAPHARSARAEFVAGWSEATRYGHQIANPRGRVTIVDIADLQCPACRAFYLGPLRETLHDFGDSISVYHIAYPLPYHPQAMKVARAAECAASSGRFAQWIDVIYSQQDSLPSETWGRLARRAGIEDSAQIARCARDTLPEARIAEQRDFGDRIGVAGTPTILINGWKLPTTPTAAQLKAEVRSFLRGEQPFGKAGAR